MRPLALLIALVLAACGATPKALDKQVRRGGEPHAALWGRALAAWARRAEEPALREAIASWKQVIALRDDDHEAYLMLARACYFLGDGFLVFDKARKDELATAFEDGLAFADRGLRALSPTYEKQRRDGKSVDDAIAGAPPEAAPFLYWYANNLLRWAHVKGTFTLMGEYKRAHALMAVVEKVAPDYFYGGTDCYFGAFLAGAPGMAGGDLAAGRKRLEASLARAPDFFETRILMAVLVAVKTKDRDLYVKSLRYILDTPVDKLADAAPENTRARKKAQNLLNETDKRFPK